MKKFWIITTVLLVLIAGGVLLTFVGSVNIAAPVQLVTAYPWRALVDEAETMNDCAACHDTTKFHTCDTCHDDHGSAEMANVPFDDLILFQGDVDDPGYIPVNDILPYRDQPGTHITLRSFLSDYGITEFESVTIASRDEGWITIEQVNLTDEALLLPHVDGVRFAAENLHVSTWLKGVWRIIVVGNEKPLILDGYHTSIGRLLLGQTTSVTIEGTDVMLRSESDGQIRTARTASRIEGVKLTDIVENPNFDTLLVRDVNNQEYVLTATEAQSGVLAQMGQHIMLVLPSRGRSQWITDVQELVSGE